MKFCINVVYVNDSGTEQPRELMALSREELAMETLGLTLAEGKQLLHELQDYMTLRQVVAHLEQHRACSRCGHRFASNGQGSREINTVFGPIAVPNPRWLCRHCGRDAGKTFRPTARCVLPASMPDKLNIVRVLTSCLARKLYPHE